MREPIDTVADYRFRDPRLLADALRHASSADRRIESNERMEFLGDSVLGFVVSEYLYRRYPEQSEGELTTLKSTVVSRATCARMSHALGLESMLEMGKGLSTRGRVPESVSGAALEAVIAAVYLDGGLEPARQLILEVAVPHIEAAAESAHQENYKSALQHHVQQESDTPPQYLLLGERGPDHEKHFLVAVEIDGRRFPSVWGKNKKEAEQQAARAAMVELGIEAA